VVIQQPAESVLRDADREEAVEFQAAFERTSRSAFLLARHMGRTTEEAEDIVQEAALRGWRYRGGRTGEFRPWFLTIVYRLCRRPSLTWLPLPASWERAVPDGIGDGRVIRRVSIPGIHGAVAVALPGGAAFMVQVEGYLALVDGNGGITLLHPDVSLSGNGGGVGLTWSGVQG
jgi:hypothetical protein